MTNPKAKSIALLSGGVDSSTTLALAQQQGFEVYALTFRYGQRHEIEIAAARRVARSLHVSRHEVLEFDLRRFGGSALTDEIAVPKDRTPSELASGIPVTYVPARNTIFLSFALAWAEVLGAADIFIGVTALDYSGYPDCRPEYVAAFQTMADVATRAGVDDRQRRRIHAPLRALPQPEIALPDLSLGHAAALPASCHARAPDAAASGRGAAGPLAASACCGPTSPSAPPCILANSRSRSRRTARCCRHPVSVGYASAPRREWSWCCDAAMS